MVWLWILVIAFLVLLCGWLLWDKYYSPNQSIPEAWDQFKDDVKNDVQSGWENVTNGGHSDNDAAWEDGLDMDSSAPNSKSYSRQRPASRPSRSKKDRASRPRGGDSVQMQQIDDALAPINSQLASLPADCMGADNVRHLQDIFGEGEQYIRQLRENCGAPGGKMPEMGRMPGWECGDFDADQGGAHCWQKDANGKRGCYRSGTKANGSGGFWTKADPRQCRDAPDCGQVMESCQGFDSSDF